MCIRDSKESEVAKLVGGKPEAVSPVVDKMMERLHAEAADERAEAERAVHVHNTGLLAMLATMHKPGESLFFGCVPMGVAVIAMGLVTFGQNVGLTGKQAHDGALVMFWIDVVLCAISMTVPPGSSHKQRRSSAGTLKPQFSFAFVGAAGSSPASRPRLASHAARGRSCIGCRASPRRLCAK